MTQNYLRDNNNLTCICNNLVLSREELFYGFAFYYVTSGLGYIETQIEIL